MATRIRDIIDDAGTLELHCPQCGKTVQLKGVKLPGSFGEATLLRGLSDRLRSNH